VRARNLVASFAVLISAGCSDPPKKDLPPPAPPARANPRLSQGEAIATTAEGSPVPSNARAVLDEHYREGITARETALAMERFLAEAKDDPFEAGPGWRVSARRALVHALRTAPRELRSELQRYQDERSRLDSASVTSEVATNHLAHIVSLAERYPNASWALSVWRRLEKERTSSSRETIDTSVPGPPVPIAGLQVSGLSIQANGDDALRARDVDGNNVWEYRAHAPPSEAPSLRCAGVFADRLVLVELRKTAGTVVEAIDATTGSELFRIHMPEVTDPPQVTVVGPEAVIATPSRTYVVDVLRGTLAWERAHKPGQALSVTADRVVYGPNASGFDLATGREVEGEAEQKRKAGTIEVR
jgi:hypothetical protein